MQKLLREMVETYGDRIYRLAGSEKLPQDFLAAVAAAVAVELFILIKLNTVEGSLE